MPVVIRSSSVGTVSPPATTVSKPAGVVDGDFLLAFVGCRAGGTMTPPSGWTLIRTDTEVNVSGMKMWSYYKFASSEPASWTWTGSTGIPQACVVAYTGVGTLNPLSPVGGGGAYGSSNIGPGTTAPVAPSITVGYPDEMLFCFAYSSPGGSTWTDPAGMTRRVTGGSIAAQQGTYDGCEVLLTGVGATAAKTFGVNVDNQVWIAQSIGIAPVPNDVGPQVLMSD